MIDTRKEYRMVFTGETSSYEKRKIYRLECRQWWAPSWGFVGIVYDEEEARQRAADHAGPREIVKLGRFPKREGEA